MESQDLQPATQAAADKMRAAAARSELQPTRARLNRAMSLLHQMRGLIAARRLELPIELEQEFSVLVHEDVLARKELQP